MPSEYAIEKLKDGWYIVVNMMGCPTVVEENGGPFVTREAARQMVKKFESEECPLCGATIGRCDHTRIA
jgi:hypothetical protein